MVTGLVQTVKRTMTPDLITFTWNRWMKNLLYIALGGSIGAVTRYILSKNIHNIFNPIFPLGTLFVNVSGSFLIGFFFYLFENFLYSNNLRSFLLIGFLGAYTTFSTYSLETVNFIREGEYRAGLINIFLSNFLCLFMVICGMIVSRVLFKALR